MGIIKSYEVNFDPYDENICRFKARLGNVRKFFYNGEGRLFVNIQHSEKINDIVDYEFILIPNDYEMDLRGTRYIDTIHRTIIHGNNMMFTDFYNVFQRKPDLIITNS